MKLHEKVIKYIEEAAEKNLEDYVLLDLGDIEVRHELVGMALNHTYGEDKIERIAEQIQEDLIDSLDCVLEHVGYWERLGNIVMCTAQDIGEPTWHVNDHRKDVL